MLPVGMTGITEASITRRPDRPCTRNCGSNSGDALLASALEGRGIILEPEFVVREALASGALIRLMRDYTWSHRSLYVVYVNRRYLPVNIRSFVDFVAEYYRQSGLPPGQKLTDTPPVA